MCHSFVVVTFLKPKMLREDECFISFTLIFYGVTHVNILELPTKTTRVYLWPLGKSTGRTNREICSEKLLKTAAGDVQYFVVVAA